MFHRRFARREIASSARQSAVFVLCTALSMVSLVSLGGFSRSVHGSLARDARELHAADLIIHSHYEFGQPLLDAAAAMERANEAKSVRLWDFYTMARAPGGASILASVRVAGAGYPFYGKVLLASGRPLEEALAPGNAVVEQALLDRLALRVGDRLGMGKAELTISDLVVREPDRPVNVFSLGPRVLVSAGDLSSLGLVGLGSRVEFSLLLKVADERSLERLAGNLRAAARPEQERVETYRTAGSGVKRFFDNLVFFLNLIGIFTLLLAGIGMQSSLAAFLREREKTIAVLKAMGATSGFILRQYLLTVCILGLAGMGVGLAGGLLVQNLLPALFSGLLPPNAGRGLSPGSVLEGFLLGAITVGIFTFLPLHRLRDVKPNAIFGRERVRGGSFAARVAAGSVVVIFFAGVVLWRIRELKTGLWFTAGVIGLVILAAVMTECALSLLRRLPRRRLAFRQALRGLSLPGNATRPILITLAASLGLIFSIRLVEGNLDMNFVRSYPPDAPNVYFLDIQKSQRREFSEALALRAEYFPVVRARVTAINGTPIIRERHSNSRGDSLTREMNLTYRDGLLEDEVIKEGGALFRPGETETQVSVLDEVLKMTELSLGDRLTFSIQGVPLEARVSSIRARTQASVRPFFYFVFPEAALKEAPQTIFAAARVSREEIPALQSRMAARFPNVSIIDVSETVIHFSGVMEKLSVIVRFFASCSIAAGLLIVVSSILATRHARIRESVYFKILGARGRFVLSVFTLENIVLGAVSSAAAVILSQATAWIVSRQVFEIPYHPFFGSAAAMTAGMIALIVTVGLLASRSILRKKPAAFLREETAE